MVVLEDCLFVLAVVDNLAALVGLCGGLEVHNSRCYEFVGTYQLQEQSLFTYMIYDDKMIVVRKYFDETKDYDNQNGIVEIESSGGKYESTKGIKIGDSILYFKSRFIRTCFHFCIAIYLLS